jgi:hypothetical protein
MTQRIMPLEHYALSHTVREGGLSAMRRTFIIAFTIFVGGLIISAFAGDESGSPTTNLRASSATQLSELESRVSLVSVREHSPITVSARSIGSGIGNTPTPTPSCTSGWNLVPSNGPPGTVNNVLRAVAVISAEDVWAVGYSSDKSTAVEHALTLHWNGTQWSTVPAPDVGTDSRYLNGVVAIASDDVWAVGYSWNGIGTPDRTLVLHWNGSDWEHIPSPNANTSRNILTSVTAISANALWAAGYYFENGMYRTQTICGRC